MGRAAERCRAVRRLQRFIRITAPTLQPPGLWDDDVQHRQDQEIAASADVPGSYWVGPLVLDRRARLLP